MKILLEDDHKIIREVWSGFLTTKLPANIKQANSVIEVVNLFETGELERVIADINMPKMDGIEMVKQIRKLNKDVKIIALSMMADSVRIKKILKAGANG